MNNIERQKDEKFWSEIASELRETLRLRPLTPDEAEAEYAAAEDEPLTEAEIQAFVEVARSTVPRERSYAERVGQADLEREVGEVIGLNRNGAEGEFAPEVEEEMRRQREAADEEDEDGLDDDKKA